MYLSIPVCSGINHSPRQASEAKKAKHPETPTYPALQCHISDYESIKDPFGYLLPYPSLGDSLTRGSFACCEVFLIGRGYVLQWVHLISTKLGKGTALTSHFARFLIPYSLYHRLIDHAVSRCIYHPEAGRPIYMKSPSFLLHPRGLYH